MDNEVKKETVNFTFDIYHIVRLSLQLFLDKHYENEEDRSKIYASNEIAYQKLTDEKITELMNAWSAANGGKLTFDGHEDSGKIWEIIWASEEFKDLYAKNLCRGVNGSGVYDTGSKSFIGCGLAQHFLAIRKLLELHHNEMFQRLREYDEARKNVNVRDIDDYIMNSMVLVGAGKNKEFYKIEKEYGQSKGRSNNA